jgi:hypothetical protein
MEKDQRIGVCGADVWLIDEKGGIQGRKEFPESHERCVRALWYRNPFCHSATLVRRSCFAACGPYDETFGPVEDLELWFRIGRRFEFRNLRETLVKYRVWSGSATARQYRLMVRLTMRARRLAPRQGGIGLTGRLAFVPTWCAQWLPPRLSQALFRMFVIGRTYGDRASVGVPASVFENEERKDGNAVSQTVR